MNFRPLVLAAVAVFAGGCATVPYHPGRNIETANTLALRPGEPQIERGRPNALIDCVGWVVGVPMKIILLDSRVDNHSIPPAVEQAIAEYLATNDLRNVKVRLNEYDPVGEWSRLFRNKSVGWGWRYTVGVLQNLIYTLFPSRLLADFPLLPIPGDHYNPFTNTINIYSGHRAIVLHEGGHAKDFAPRDWKGTYAFLYFIPFAALYPEAKATGDAIGYMRVDCPAEEEKEAYKILYPAYGTYVGGAIGQFTPVSTLVYFAAVIPGHIVGRVKASHVDERRQTEANGTPNPEAKSAP